MFVDENIVSLKGAFVLQKKTKLIAGIGALIVLLGGTGAIFLTGGASHKKPVATFIPPNARAQQPGQLLSLQKRERTVDSKHQGIYSHIPVTTKDGANKTISVKDQPVIFVSDWYPKILDQLKGIHLKSTPVLISVNPKKGETVGQGITSLEKYAQVDGLKVDVVALASNKPLQWMTGIPDTYIWQKGKVVEIPGILPTSDVSGWSTVLS